MVSGVATLRELCLMSGFLILMLLRTGNPSPPATESIRTREKEPTSRVCEVEHGSFTPLVFSLTGGMGKAASVCYKRLASLIAAKRDALYSSTIAWIRCSLSFSLLRSSIQCICGTRSATGHTVKQPIPPIDLVSTEARFSTFC